MVRHGPGSLKSREAEEGVGGDEHGCGAATFE